MRRPDMGNVECVAKSRDRRDRFVIPGVIDSRPSRTSCCTPFIGLSLRSFFGDVSSAKAALLLPIISPKLVLAIYRHLVVLQQSRFAPSSISYSRLSDHRKRTRPPPTPTSSQLKP